MKEKVIKVLTIIFMIFLIANISNIVYADDINPDDFKDIYNKSGISDLDNKTGKILNVVQIGGTAASAIALIILGMRYMLSSPEEKATIKERLMPYVIGVIIFFAASNLVAIVVRFAQAI